VASSNEIRPLCKEILHQTKYVLTNGQRTDGWMSRNRNASAAFVGGGLETRPTGLVHLCKLLIQVCILLDTGLVKFPEINKSLEVITSIIFIRMADIPGSRAKNKLFCLDTMHKVMHKGLESCFSRTCFLQHHLAMLDLDTSVVRVVKFPEIQLLKRIKLKNYLTNFQKFQKRLD